MRDVTAGIAYIAPANADVAKPSIVQKFADKPKEAKVNPSFDIIGSSEFLNLFSNHHFRFLNKVVFYKSAISAILSMHLMLKFIPNEILSNTLTCYKFEKNVLIASTLTYC